MNKKVNAKRAFSEIALFMSAFLLIAWIFTSCQKDDAIMVAEEVGNTEEVGLRNGENADINLDYPLEVSVDEAFDITFSSACGKIMLEKGFVEELNEENGLITKVYVDLTCDMENLMWEPVDVDEFESCAGKTISNLTLETPGTYVYRAKLNFKAQNNSDCSDCTSFVGNQFQCFMITAVESVMDTWTDGRDGKKYNIITIGNQTWMAENLAYNGPDREGNQIAGIYAYDNDENNVPDYGRLYTYAAAKAACPDGWDLPSADDWLELITYVKNNYGCSESDTWTAWALAAPNVWPAYYDDNPDTNPVSPGCPGYLDCSGERSGFAALPAGIYDPEYSKFKDLGLNTIWWSSTIEYGYDSAFEMDHGCPNIIVREENIQDGYRYSVRYIKKTE
jgi:uncharacterized protein (TIGR02145 family)